MERETRTSYPAEALSGYWGWAPTTWGGRGKGPVTHLPHSGHSQDLAPRPIPVPSHGPGAHGEDGKVGELLHPEGSLMQGKAAVTYP
jgi:hypothetical protein